MPRTRAIFTAFLLASAIVTATRAEAQGASPPSKLSVWYTGIASGWYFPIQHWPTQYINGGGGTYLLGRQLDPWWAVQFDIDMSLLSGSQNSTWDMKAGPLVRWTPAPGRVAFFGLAGLGVNVQTSYPSQSSTLGPVVTLGAGVGTAVGEQGDFFLEGMHYILFRAVETRVIPLLAGFRLRF